MSKNRKTDSLRVFFEPASVAVVGASRNTGKGGYNIIENLLRLGYPGRIYPINPRAKHILGLDVYNALKDTPEPPELGRAQLGRYLAARGRGLRHRLDRGVGDRRRLGPGPRLGGRRWRLTGLTHGLEPQPARSRTRGQRQQPCGDFQSHREPPAPGAHI